MEEEEEEDKGFSHWSWFLLSLVRWIAVERGFGLLKGLERVQILEEEKRREYHDQQREC